jgi:polynucleotide 5'-kinase involved in rRNA processing
LLDRALQLAVHTTLIDTTGLVDGPLEVEIKLQKIDLLRPTQVIALARGTELDPILRACRQRQDLTVRQLPIAAAVRQRSSEERRATRQDKYRAYFARASLCRFSLDEVEVWGRVPHSARQEAQGLLVGLLDGHGLCLGVGRLHEMSPTAVEIWASCRVAPAVRLLRFGSVAVDRQGTERLFSPRQL